MLLGSNDPFWLWSIAKEKNIGKKTEVKGDLAKAKDIPIEHSKNEDGESMKLSKEEVELIKMYRQVDLLILSIRSQMMTSIRAF